MRILFLSNLYPPHDLGGMEIRCKETVDMLCARGHVCHVLTSRFRVADAHRTEEGVSRRLHLQANINYYRPLDFFLRRPWQQRANRQALRRVVDGFRPDVIFVWGMWNLSRRVAYWAERRLPGRVAYAVASYWLIEPDVHEGYWQSQANRVWANALKAPLRWLALRRLARERKADPLTLREVACVSRYVRSKLLEANALPHGARVIYNGIDPDPFLDAQQRRPTADEDTLRLVYVGGILPHKGVHTAVEAMGVLWRRGLQGALHLTLVGGGHPDYQTELRRRVAQLGLEDQVAFHGRVPRERVPSVLADSDVFVFPSIWEEPIARSVMEAMAAGLAVVGTPVGGQREMLEDGQNALVFAPDDAEELAECILRLWRRPDLRARLADRGRRTILERFTLKRMVDEIEAWLESVIE